MLDEDDLLIDLFWNSKQKIYRFSNLKPKFDLPLIVKAMAMRNSLKSIIPRNRQVLFGIFFGWKLIEPFLSWSNALNASEQNSSAWTRKEK